MKIYNDRFVLKLLKENIIYIIGVVLFIMLLIIFLPPQLQSIAELKSTLNNKNEQLEARKDLFEIARASLSFDVKSMDVITKSMFPADEDYFSIFRALELLAARSGIFIETFSSPFGNKQGAAVKIEVSALGNSEAVTRLLTNYQLKSSRLVTIDRIGFDAVASKITFSINFFTIPVPAPATTQIPKIKQSTLDSILSFTDTQSNAVVVSSDYIIKSNPFAP